MIGGGIGAVCIVIIIIIAVTLSMPDDNLQFTSSELLAAYPLIDA